MILLCDRDVTRHARDARERVGQALALALYERLAAEGDVCVALLAVGEFYAVLSLSWRHAPLSAREAVEVLTAGVDADPPEGDGSPERRGGGESGGPGATDDAVPRPPFSDELLVAAAQRVGCAVVCGARRGFGRHDEGAEIVALLEGRGIDPRLCELLA